MARPKVTYRIEVEQDCAEVRGNFSSGDDGIDKAMEDTIIYRMERGDVWAWAEVTVVAECQGFEGRDHLCGCSYENEAAQRGREGKTPHATMWSQADLTATDIKRIVFIQTNPNEVHNDRPRNADQDAG